MGATATAISSFFAADAGATAVTAAELGSWSAGGAGIVAAGGATAADWAGTAALAAATGGAASSVAKGAGTALGTGLVTSALAPKPPKAAPVTPMPDPFAQEEARKRALIEQNARRGRASTILTDQPASSGSLGG